MTRMAYDAESKKTILVGGVSFTAAAEQFNETWAYDYASNAWTKMNPKIQPPGLCDHTLDYDSESDRVVLWAGRLWTGEWIGGWGNGEWSSWTTLPQANLVWAYDYNSDSWESFPVTDGPVVSIDVRYPNYFGSAYIYGMDRILYYWEDQLYAYDYNHNTWEKAQGDLVPHAGYRILFGMAYLASIQRLLVFGGQTMDAKPYDNTWLYYPQTGDWTQVGP